MDPAAENHNHKFGVRLSDGYIIEAVYFGSGTLCISTQVGCAVGCPFCASGSRGLKRNLSLAELDLQLAAACQRGFNPVRLTLSGIGEPLHNPGPVRQFVLSQKEAGMPVSLTTTGGPLKRFAEFINLSHNGLMLSLHAGTSRTHRRLIPGGPKFDDLLQTIRGCWRSLSRGRRRKVGVNYLLLAGINDTRAELENLAAILHSFPEITLHLLPCNNVSGSPLAASSSPKFDAAYQFFREKGLNVRRANRWRRQSDGGCGTLFVRRENDMPDA